jgi:GxxExxY protein
MDTDGTQMRQPQPYENQPRIDADLARIGEALGSSHLLHRELTEKILGAAFAVHSELGSGFLEKVYATALMYELKDRGLNAVSEAQVPVLYKNRPAGVYYADVLVEEAIVCEIKAVRALLPEHQVQVLHYLTATGKPVGLLFNFGSSSLQFKRLAKTK